MISVPAAGANRGPEENGVGGGDNSKEGDDVLLTDWGRPPGSHAPSGSDPVRDLALGSEVRGQRLTQTAALHVPLALQQTVPIPKVVVVQELRGELRSISRVGAELRPRTDVKGNVGSCSLPADPSCLSSLDYYHANKARYSVGDRGVRLLHGTPPPGSNPAGKRLTSAGKYFKGFL
ncbi:unnamed protein product [Gadus morhua 'NCC']